MNWLDLVLLFSLLIAVVSGIAKGFARSLVSLASFIAAVGAGLWFYAPLGFRLHSYMDSKPAANATAFFIVFIGVMIAGGILENHAWKFVKESDLTVADRALGGVFGVAHGVFSACVWVLVFLAFAPPGLAESVSRSRALPYLTGAAHAMAVAAPDEIREGYQRARRDLDRVAPEGVREGLDRLGSY